MCAPLWVCVYPLNLSWFLILPILACDYSLTLAITLWWSLEKDITFWSFWTQIFKKARHVVQNRHKCFISSSGIVKRIKYENLLRNSRNHDYLYIPTGTWLWQLKSNIYFWYDHEAFEALYPTQISALSSKCDHRVHNQCSTRPAAIPIAFGAELMKETHLTGSKPMKCRNFLM